MDDTVHANVVRKAHKRHVLALRYLHIDPCCEPRGVALEVLNEHVVGFLVRHDLSFLHVGTGVAEADGKHTRGA